MQNIVIAGKNLNNVPSIEAPLQSSGMAVFVDTSDANATASDIISGKTAYVNGTKITGTGSGGGQTVYTSSTGLLYYATMTINVGMESTSGQTIATAMTRYGEMPYLEDLTITGICRNNGSSVLLAASSTVFTVQKYPRLKTLRIQPTETRNSTGGTYASDNALYNCFKFGHYIFAYTNLTTLILGKVGGPYWAGGGYFRNKDENGNTTSTIGSTAGLTLKVYTDQYRAKGGFANGNVASNTTIIEYDYLTGEILTQ